MMIKYKSVIKYFYFFVGFIIIFISFTFCACNPDESNKNTEDTNLNKPENVNYPVEGIWYSSVMRGNDLRDSKNNQLSGYVEYCIWFMPGGGIQTKWKTNSKIYSNDEWKVRDFTWKIEGYIVDLSNDDKKIVIVDDKFTYYIPDTENFNGYKIFFTNNERTFTKTEDKVFQENI